MIGVTSFPGNAEALEDVGVVGDAGWVADDSDAAGRRRECLIAGADTRIGTEDPLLM